MNRLRSDHSDVAIRLNNLIPLYHAQGCYAETEPLIRHAQTIDEQAIDHNHPNVATSLNNLTQLYYSQGRYAEVEPLQQRASAIQAKQALGNPTQSDQHS